MSTARELTKHLAALLRKEKNAMADFLLALADFDASQRWRELGHTSLFNFLRRELKLSAGAAQNRKTAVELIRKFPSVEAALRSGDLCLSTINSVAKVLTAENEKEVLPRFFGLSYSEAEAIVAELRPVPVIPARDRVVPVAATVARTVALAPVAPPRQEPMAEAEAPLLHTSEIAQPERVEAPGPARPMNQSVRPELVEGRTDRGALRDDVDPLDAELARLHTTVSRRFLAKLAAAKDALAHTFPDGNTADVLERGLDLVLAEHARRKGLVERPLKTPRPSRCCAIPARVKREVWRRAGGRCEFVLASGERCCETRKLEYDHIEPEALGGKPTVENVRLVCRGHNVLAARRVFGDAVMDRYVGKRANPARARRASGTLPLGTFPTLRAAEPARNS